MHIAFSGLKNDLWLAKRFCQRAGLSFAPRDWGRPPFGMISYRIIFPNDFTEADATRLIRVIRTSRAFAIRRFRYALMHELWRRWGREMVWSRRLQSRTRAKPIVG
jgi:hypothetical protein